MGQRKVVNSIVLSALEVSSIEQNDLIKLLNVLAHRILPVSRLNITRQEELHNVEFDVHLLNGTDAPKERELDKKPR